MILPLKIKFERNETDFKKIASILAQKLFVIGSKDLYSS